MAARERDLKIRQFDDRFLEKFNESGPYYSSYPTLSRWTEDFDSDSLTTALEEFLDETPEAPLYFYAHTPFCAKLCWYCICNVKISNNYDTIQEFVDVICSEIDFYKVLFERIGRTPNIREIHLGGGTPSHLRNDQLKKLVDSLAGLVNLSSLDEFAMEIDPRTTTQDNLRYYGSLGIDRISFGVQDFDPTVQERINRVQPFEMVRDLLSPGIRSLFKGVNFDLLFGLPMQTRETFRRTVEQTIALSPERITLIRYAHVPEVRRHMKMIQREELPPAEDLPVMFREAIEAFTEAGYLWVGIDNLAKPTDELGRAAMNRTVGRNFSGSTPGRADNIIGVGPTTTSCFGDHYFQSVYDNRKYYKSVRDGRSPVFKGYRLNPDERLRRDVIFRIQCDQMVDFAAIEQRHGVDFRDYFSREITTLAPLEADGIIELAEGSLTVTPFGRYFVRHVCKIFDRFLQDGSEYKIHGP